MTKTTISARVSGQTSDRIEDYAEENDLSKSEATSRLLDKALKIEHGEAEVLITDGSGEQKLNTVQQKVIQLQEKVNQLQSELPEPDTEPDNSEMIVNITGLIYIAGVITLDVSPIVSILTGLTLLLLVVYTQVENWRDYLGDLA
jgi:VIT1/CCC1 family predicted Fe2+/Mn2+ transporter